VASDSGAAGGLTPGQEGAATNRFSFNWDGQILVIYSVLAGLAFAEIFRTLGDTGYGTTFELVVAVFVFYVIFDNWYFIHQDLNVFDIERPTEVTLYTLSAVVNSCLPYLFVFVREPFGLIPPQWLLVNLVLITLFDAARKFIILRRLKKQGLANFEQRRLWGTYVFYFGSGLFYTVGLSLVLMALHSSSLPLERQAIMVVATWILLRIVDNIVIKMWAEKFTGIFDDGAR